MIVRCRSCLLPKTRPDTAFIGGECAPCVNHRNRAKIDWNQRKSELLRILDATPINGSGYTCIVPSSGGKDSTYLALTLIDLGARPLVVTATTCMLTEVGRRNIDNLSRYATTIEYTPNRSVRAKLNRLGLQMVGDCSWPEHIAINSIPFRIARDLGIPTLFYGENPCREYGAPIGAEEALTMTRQWIAEFGGQLGLRPNDMVGLDDITDSDMADYILPTNSELKNINAYFLGQFISWDSQRNAKVAKASGMQFELPHPGNWWDFENLDCGITGAHDFFAWLKYGLGRASVQLSVDIRNGLILRDDAFRIAKERDGLFPDRYMGITLDDALNLMKLDRKSFIEICNKFINRSIFVEDRIEWGQQLTLREDNWDENSLILKDKGLAA